MDIKKNLVLAAEIRKKTIDCIASIGFGHIGGSMSIADLLAVLYGEIISFDVNDIKKDDRDFFVMSKGHCGPVLYATLALKGFFPIEELNTLNKLGTRLPSHADHQLTPGIDMTTGSLGQGASAAVGIAMANKIKGLNNYTYLVVGDGELQEGQVWEALMFASHWNLNNLIIFVDYNKKQLDGYVRDINNLNAIDQRIKAFGYNVITIDGHNVSDIYQSIIQAKENKDMPNVIILDTEKGHGCNFAENVEFNHYMVINSKMAENAKKEIDRRLEKALVEVVM